MSARVWTYNPEAGCSSWWKIRKRGQEGRGRRGQEGRGRGLAIRPNRIHRLVRHGYCLTWQNSKTMQRGAQRSGGGETISIVPHEEICTHHVYFVLMSLSLFPDYFHFLKPEVPVLDKEGLWGLDVCNLKNSGSESALELHGEGGV